MSEFKQELAIVAKAYDQANQVLLNVDRTLNRIAKSADQVQIATDKVAAAFGEAVAKTEGYRQSASGLLVPLSAVTAAETSGAKATKERTKATKDGAAATKEQTKATQDDTKATEQQTTARQKGKKTADEDTDSKRKNKKATEESKDAAQEFYQTLGALGAIRVVQQGITGLTSLTRQYGAEIKQISIIADDAAGALNRQAMSATQGTRGPRELASVYQELGAAGVSAREIVASTSDVINVATDAMISQAEAAEGMIAASTSFQIPMSQSSKIADAFAQALNRTTLGGRDLTFALASIGPVAGMAGQSLGQTIAAVAALRNAGARAQDAATSVRAAMLALSAPSKESADLMDRLNIRVFDAAGNMKKWSDIVAEFERALAPYNQQARQMALTTILNSDGIRAMAAGMQMGSANLADLATNLEKADGSAARMAADMQQTLDGAMRQMAGNAERAALVVGKDLEPSIISVTGFLNKLETGFATMDEGTRRLMERLIGGAGLAVALSGVARVLALLSPGLVSVAGWLNKLGPTILTVKTATEALKFSLGGVLGIVGLVAAAVGLAYGTWQAYQAGEQQAALTGLDHAEQLRQQADRVKDLGDELQKLSAVAHPSNEEQDRMRQLTGELIKLAPEAAGGIDLMSLKVKDLGQMLQGTSNAMERLLAQSKVLAQGAAAAARGKLPTLEAQEKDLRGQVESWTEILNSGPLIARDRIINLGSGFEQFKNWFRDMPNEEAMSKAADHLNELIGKLADVQQQLASARAAVQGAAAVGGHSSGMDEDAVHLLERSIRGSTSPAGGALGVEDLLGAGDQSKFSDRFKAMLQGVLDTLVPYKGAVSDVAGELDILNAKQAFYLGLLQDGKAGIEAVAGAENARVQIVDKLKQHQDALHQANDANRATLQTLTAKQADLDQQLARGAITSDEHADASRTLRQELDRLRESVTQNSSAWWRDEQAIASAEAAAGNAAKTIADAQQRLNDERYQQATGAMRHEVAMRRLSVDQQIAVVRQMLAEMTLSTDQAGSLQEQLVGLYGEKIKQESDRIQEAYQGALDGVNNTLESTLAGIDSRLKATIGPLQAQLKALEGEARGNERERALEDHNKKLADLQKQRQYHALRTGKEHQTALQQLDEQIGDENRRWQQQQDDWGLADRRQAIQDKIQTAEDGAKDERDKAEAAAKQQRKDLEDHYKEVQKITQQGILDTIAAMAATDPQWFSTGKGLIDNLIAGLQSGDFSSVLATIASVQTAADAAAAAAAKLVSGYTGGALGANGPPAGNTPSSLAYLDTVRALAAGGNYLGAAGLLAQQSGMSLAQAKTNIKGLVGHDIPGFKDGALVLHETIARFAEGNRPEIALPVEKSVPILGAAMQYAARGGWFGADMGQVLAAALQPLVQAIRSRPAGDVRVYGAENAYLEDPVDADMLGRSVARQVLRQLPAGG